MAVSPEHRWSAARLGPARRVVLRQERLLLEERLADGGWRALFEEPLPVPAWRTRELARLLDPAGPVPVRPLRELEGVRRLLAQLLGPLEEELGARAP